MRAVLNMNPLFSGLGRSLLRKYLVLTKSVKNISNSLVHGHVYQSSPQAEVREHQQAFL